MKERKNTQYLVNFDNVISLVNKRLTNFDLTCSQMDYLSNCYERLNRETEHKYTDLKSDIIDQVYGIILSPEMYGLEKYRYIKYNYKYKIENN